MNDQQRCEGRYPVPATSPPREEPFEVTYRCSHRRGHDGPCGDASLAPRAAGTPEPLSNRPLEDRALAVTRLEVIDESGRALTRRPCEIELSFQDDGRTLKVFVRGGVKSLPEGTPRCTCLSISRDPLCVYHGNVDKVKELAAGAAGTPLKWPDAPGTCTRGHTERQPKCPACHDMRIAVLQVGAMLQAPTLPAAGEVGTRPREPYPIPLNAEQERAAKNWAADDRLWTTQETVQFNLGTFAREVLKHQAAGLPDGAALQALVEELLQRIEGGHKQSIGSIDNVRMVQYDVEELARYRAELAALALRPHSEEGPQ